MASPLAHTTIAYAIHRLLQPAQAQTEITLLQSIILSNLPDLDALLGLLFKDMKRFHNNVSHSLITGLAVSMLAAALPGSTATEGSLARRRQTTSLRLLQFSQKTAKQPKVAHVFLHYTLHLLTDLLSHNKRGLMLFAPISKRRFQLPITLFYGLRWGSGLFSASHLWTLATELLFTLFVLQALKIFRKISMVK